MSKETLIERLQGCRHANDLWAMRDEIVEALANKPSAELDLKATEEAFEKMAKQIDDAPLGIPPSIYADRHWSLLLRGAITMARSNHDAFHSCLPVMEKQRKELAEARATLEAIEKLHFKDSATMSPEHIIANLRSMAFDGLNGSAGDPPRSDRG